VTGRGRRDRLRERLRRRKREQRVQAVILEPSTGSRMCLYMALLPWRRTAAAGFRDLRESAPGSIGNIVRRKRTRALRWLNTARRAAD
jgi:hypothetical protein